MKAWIKKAIEAPKLYKAKTKGMIEYMIADLMSIGCRK